MWNYVYQAELYHYGVKGMKWGVRRYQNKDGSLTPSGKKRYDDAPQNDTSVLVKKLANRKFDADAEMEKISEQHKKDSEELDRKYKVEKWWDSNGRLTDEAAKRMDAYDKLDEMYNKKYDKLYDKRDVEIRDIREKLFLSDAVKPSLLKAKELRKQLDTLYDETVDYKSKAYKDTYKTWLKENGVGNEDEDAYGFDHYYWPKSKERSQAMDQYKAKADKLNKEYSDIITDVGNKVVGNLKDQKMDDDWYDTYGDWGRTEVDELIRFNRIKFSE